MAKKAQTVHGRRVGIREFSFASTDTPAHLIHLFSHSRVSYSQVET